MGIETFSLGRLEIGSDCAPIVIPEAGINHEGSLDRALELVRSAHSAGAQVIKFQTHIPEEEMIHTDVVPEGISSETLWDIISRCSLSSADERKVAAECERLGMEFLSTPFSVAAVDRLVDLGVNGFKVGSGEVSNPFILQRIAATGLPVILSTGMHTNREVRTAFSILRQGGCPVVLLHCISVYPAPHELMAIQSVPELIRNFPGTPVGISDHSEGIWTALGAVALGACVVEKHFTVDRGWPGPDMPVSIEPRELRDLIAGSTAIWESLRQVSGEEEYEQSVRNFAVSSIVTTTEIAEGALITESSLTLKRPGTGDFHADDLVSVIGARAARAIAPNQILRREDLLDRSPAGDA